MNYVSILSICNREINILEQKDNPDYDKEFDRLEDIGIYTSDYIHDELNSRNIEEKICKIKTVHPSKMSIAEFIRIIAKMNIEDLIKLSSNIVDFYVAESLVNRMIKKKQNEGR